jgi:tetratricopeptide (TPR) repeat protein/tRNA A-37 threonylcarbamoyl transferase component Bud32
MPGDAQVKSLLEEILESDCTPEEACQACPELLIEVRHRLRRVRALEAEVEALFPTPGPASTPGDLPDGRSPELPGYDVQSILGRGGMGVVYKARHRRLNRAVALKMLITGAYAGPDERARFQREAEAVASLHHANIVAVHDVGDHEGCPYFTMELLEGGSLARALGGTPQPDREAAALLITLAEAVQAAHRAGIVHRDMKPANILLTADGTPKVADFGLARHFEGEPSLTLSGARVGTPSYMAPEQVSGRTGTIGPAADIYALGALLYEVLTGRPPFRGETATETERQVIHDEPVPPSRLNTKVPRDLETICLKCLSKEPQRRYASAAALADDLRRFGEGRPIQARSVGWGERSWRWCRRNPTVAALLVTALALVGLASGGGMSLVQRRAELHNDVATAVAQAERFRKGFHFREARESLERVRQRLEPAGPDDLRRQLEQAQADLNLAERLDAARIKAATLAGGKDGLVVAEPLYVSAFAEAGLGREGDDSKAVSARVRDSALSAELIAALDDWASITADRSRREWLLAVASAADQNSARNRLRQPELWRDGARLTRIAQEQSGAEVSPQLAIALDRAAHQVGGDVKPLLTAVQARYPQDFWINFGLGATLGEARRWDEALGFFRAALAVRPGVSAAHNNLGEALYAKDRREEAMGQFKEALRLDRDSIAAHLSLGSALRIEGRLEEAIDHFQRVLQLNPNLAVAQVGLSATISDAVRTALRTAAGQDAEKGRLDESERARLRLRALGWLRAYLELVIRLRDSGERRGWSPARWPTDSALASVRDPAELAKLPAAEREQWQRLWADVAAQVAADPREEGWEHAARRDWAPAADCYARRLTLGPTDDGHIWFEYAALSLLSGDRPGYVRACAHMTERCDKSGGPRAYHVARACTLAPDASALASLPGRSAQKELKEFGREFWSLTEQGALAYRAGRFQQAVRFFEQSLQADLRPGRAVVNWLWLALAKQRLEKAEEARRWLDKAQAWLDQYGDEMPARAEEELGLHFHNWLEAHVLRREAEALIPCTGPRVRLASPP